MDSKLKLMIAKSQQRLPKTVKHLYLSHLAKSNDNFSVPSVQFGGQSLSICPVQYFLDKLNYRQQVIHCFYNIFLLFNDYFALLK